MAGSITSRGVMVPWSRSSVIQPSKAPGTTAARRHVPAEPVLVGLDHLEREGGGDRGVEGVAALLEDPHGDARRDPVGGGDDAEGALDLGPQGEHRGKILHGSGMARTIDSASPRGNRLRGRGPAIPTASPKPPMPWRSGGKGAAAATGTGGIRIPHRMRRRGRPWRRRRWRKR